MPKKIEGPLDSTDYMQINTQLRDLENLQKDLQQAQAANIDCENDPQHCQYLIDSLNKIKQVYFPGKP